MVDIAYINRGAEVSNKATASILYLDLSFFLLDIKKPFVLLDKAFRLKPRILILDGSGYFPPLRKKTDALIIKTEYYQIAKKEYNINALVLKKKE